MENIDVDIFKTIESQIEPQRGRILIADPFSHGLVFMRSIILLTEHNDEGSVGFVLNKPTDVCAEDLIDDILNFKGLLHFGGPVHTNTLHYLHTLGEKVPDSIKITNSIYWSGNFETLKSLINSGKANPKTVKFFMGYTGWIGGQLEEELKENSWVVSTVADKTIMEANSISVWNNILSELGGDFKMWANCPFNPQMN